MASVDIGGERTTWDDLEDSAAALSRSLAGARAAAVVMHPTLATVRTVVAGLAAGVPIVPLAPYLGDVERTHALADSGADVLVERGVITALSSPWVGEAPSGALVLYTSGTTGPPKGVPVTVEAITRCLGGLAEAWAWTAEDTLVHGLPLFHVHGLVLGVLGARHVGCSLVHTGRPTPEAYARAGGSLYFGVPTVWSRLAQDAPSAHALRTARLLVSGSAALPRPVAEALVALAGQAPVERYGMTETLITLAARADGPRRAGTVGGPLPGTRTRVVDDDGAPLPPGSPGTLEVDGPTVFAGYHGRRDATDAAFTADGWFRTGDVASVDEDGTHRILGRASTDLIKSGGYRIGAGEVEDALLAHPGVREAAVVGLPDEDLGQRIVAFVVADGVTEAELVDAVATTLARHKRPRQVVLVDALPRNAMGKVEKPRLRA